MRSIAAIAASGWRRPRLGGDVYRVSHSVLDHPADPELGRRVLVLVREAGDEPDVRARVQRRAVEPVAPTANPSP